MSKELKRCVESYILDPETGKELVIAQFVVPKAMWGKECYWEVLGGYEEIFEENAHLAEQPPRYKTVDRLSESEPYPKTNQDQ